MNNDEELTLFGFPVIVTDTVPEGEILLGSFPTWKEILEHGSFEAAIEAQKNRWVKITGIVTEPGRRSE